MAARMRAAMATPRSALMRTSSSRSSVSSSSFRLVSTLAILSDSAVEVRDSPWRSSANQLRFGSRGRDVVGFALGSRKPRGARVRPEPHRGEIGGAALAAILHEHLDAPPLGAREMGLERSDALV